MNSTMSVLRLDHETIISVNGSFDYDMLSKLETSYNNKANETLCSRRFIVDLASTEYTDSSAIGMLNVLRVLVGIPGENGGATVEIINVRPSVRLRSTSPPVQ